MTGCGCLVVLAGLVALLVVFIRGSFDSGEPVARAIVLAAAVALLLDRWRGEGSSDELVRARRA